jgi:6-phosphofructokinase
MGVASMIDNDVYGSEITIGVDTALNIALEAIDRLKVTAASHHRAFLVEVMGRDCGFLALMSGIPGGAEAVVIPEMEIAPRPSAKRSKRPTSAASRTPLSSSPKAPSTTPPNWPLTSRRQEGA